ncbi:hypothetical protein AB0D57_33100 [Streptomyces sp. NPDC048275]|uniref:hypothetical protein n=1 Tax=Streptomyces sp. NPDC048275 TaxID=3155629 RepID=UPI0034081B0E
MTRPVATSRRVRQISYAVSAAAGTAPSPVRDHAARHPPQLSQLPVVLRAR